MRTRTTILAGIAALGLSLLASPVTQAAVSYEQLGTIGGGTVRSPFGVAVDQANNDVYVSGFFSASRLDRFAYQGSLVQPSPFGEGAQFGNGYFFSGVAVDPLDGNLDVVEGILKEIQTYNPVTGKLLSHFSVAGSENIFELFTAVQIATDAAGDIYFPNPPHNEVQEFDPAGDLLAPLTGSGAEALKEPTGVAVDAAGNVYVADNGNGRVEEFTSAGAFVKAIGTGVDRSTGGDVCTAASGDTCGPGADGSQALALDGEGDLLVGENSGAGFHVVVYGPADEQLADFGRGVIGSSELGAIDTLAVGPTGLVYVTDAGYNLVRVYAQPHKPALLNVSASAVKPTTATLNATIDAGHSATTYRFEYGTSTAYGTSAPAPDQGVGDGGLESTPATVARELSGLQPGTTYHYRLVATNAAGQTVGSDQTFTTPPPTPPVVATRQASGVGQNGATLTGSVDTHGYETVYEFDLGVDTSYGTRIFGEAGVQPGAQTFLAALKGLTPGATYHYRIAATNAFGTVYGADQTFTTMGYPTATLAPSTSPPLLPTTLLAPTASSGSAIAAAVKPVAAIARHTGSKPGHRSNRKRRPAKAGRARRESKGGKR